MLHATTTRPPARHTTRCRPWCAEHVDGGTGADQLCHAMTYTPQTGEVLLTHTPTIGTRILLSDTPTELTLDAARELGETLLALALVGTGTEATR